MRRAAFAAALSGLVGATSGTAVAQQAFDAFRVMAPPVPTQALPGDDHRWTDACTPVAATPAAPPASAAEAMAPAGGTGSVAAGPSASALASAMPAGEPLTLARATTRALCANPQTRQAWLAVISQSAQVGQAKAAYLPTASVSASLSRDLVDTQNPLTSESTRSNARITGRNYTVSWLLFDFGTRAATVSQAEDNLAAAMASHDATLQQVFAATAQAWYEASANGAAVRAALQAEETARETLAAATARQRAGAATLLDTLQARTALSQATLARVRAQGSEQTALGTLARALDVSPTEPLALATDAQLDPEAGTTVEATPGADFARGIETLIDEALASHPSLLAARAQLGAAEARFKAIRAEGLPTVSFSYGNYLNGRPGTTLSGSPSHERLSAITVTFPLFEGFGREYRLLEQQAQVRSRSADLDAARSQVSFDVWRSYQQLAVEAASVEASADLVRSAKAALAAAQARYLAGAADIVELLNTQRDAANGLQERIQSLSNWRVARLRLLASLGRLGFWAL